MTGPRSLVELGRDPWSRALCSCGMVTPCCPLVLGLQVTGPALVAITAARVLA